MIFAGKSLHLQDAQFLIILCFRSAKLVIRSNKSHIRGQHQQNLKIVESKCEALKASEKCSELNNNSIDLVKSIPPENEQLICNDECDSLIQNQCEILNMAVKNILAVSSENIYVKKTVSRTPSLKCFSSENILEKDHSLASIVEDSEFKEALFRFSEESLSMSADNILTNSLKKITKKSRSQSTHQSMNINTFPLIAQGKSLDHFRFGCACLAAAGFKELFLNDNHIPMILLRVTLHVMLCRYQQGFKLLSANMILMGVHDAVMMVVTMSLDVMMMMTPCGHN